MLKRLLAQAESEVIRLRASLTNIEGEANKLKEEIARLQGLLIKARGESIPC